eukprot:gene30790-40089_t
MYVKQIGNLSTLQKPIGTTDIRALFESLEKNLSNVLEIGCGDRPLIPGFMYADGVFQDRDFSLHAIDFSRSVIDLLVQKSNAEGSSISYKYMDARSLEYGDEYFNFIVDKGTIDAMLCSEHVESAHRNVSKIISEAVRCLNKSSGVLMIISHVEVDSAEFEVLVMEIILPVLNEHRDRFWRIDAHNKKRQRGGEGTTKVDKEEQKQNSFGTVYMISSSFRRKTTRLAARATSRSGGGGGGSSGSKNEEAFDIPFEVHEYTSS